MTTKKYLNIREVSELINLKEHVIRYWDSIDPKTKKIRIEGISTKSKRGTRYFSKENINKLLNLKSILYDDGDQIQSIKIAEKLLNFKKKQRIANNENFHDSSLNMKKDKNIDQILKNMRNLLK